MEINSKMLIASSGDRILPWMENCIQGRFKSCLWDKKRGKTISEAHSKALKDMANTSGADAPCLVFHIHPATQLKGKFRIYGARCADDMN